MTDELLEWRREFPILESTAYLISHSLGAMPRRTYERLQAYADAWATRGVRAWAEGWWKMPLTVGDEVARIIGADPGTVVMHQNVSVCQSIILSCFDTTPETRRNKIVYSELEFPSVMYVYEAHAREGRFRIHKVKSEDGFTAPLEATLRKVRPLEPMLVLDTESGTPVVEVSLLITATAPPHGFVAQTLTVPASAPDTRKA